MKVFGYLKGICIVGSATFWLILACGWKVPGSFAANSVLGLVGLTLLITVLGYVGFYAIALVVVVPLSIERPGLLLQLLLGTAGGAASVWLSHILLPHMVLLHSPLAIVNFALANTIFTMLLAFQAGHMRRPVRLMPEFSCNRCGCIVKD